MKFHGFEIDFAAAAQFLLALGTVLGLMRARSIKANKREIEDGKSDVTEEK